MGELPPGEKLAHAIGLSVRSVMLAAGELATYLRLSQSEHVDLLASIAEDQARNLEREAATIRQAVAEFKSTARAALAKRGGD